MKKTIFLFVAVFAAWISHAQAPDLMSFQAVMRDANSNLVTNQNVGVQVSVIQGSLSGLAVYIERHTPTTNDNGLATLEIGAGTPVTGDFSTIDWSMGPFFLKSEVDLSGGSSYTIAGTSQLLSVPYALYAQTAEAANETDPVFGSSVAQGINSQDTMDWNNDLVDDADADPANELQTLTLAGDTLSIVNGNSVLLPYDSAIWCKKADTVFYNGGNVGIGSGSPSAKLEVHGDFIRTISYETGNGPIDYTDNGRILSRSINFIKKRSDTKLRISYTDALRCITPGGGRACRWEIRIDSLPCPAQQLIYDIYVNVPNEDSHRSRTIVGYCDGMSAGSHEIQIWVGTTPGRPPSDCHTGWNNSTWVIEVEEVF